MTSREQFEAWFPEMVDGLPKGIVEVFDKMLFTAWEASRAAIEIELPAACGDDEYWFDGVFQPLRYERDVERAIQKCGLKVKGEP